AAPRRGDAAGALSGRRAGGGVHARGRGPRGEPQHANPRRRAGRTLARRGRRREGARLSLPQPLPGLFAGPALSGRGGGGGAAGGGARPRPRGGGGRGGGPPPRGAPPPPPAAGPRPASRPEFVNDFELGSFLHLDDLIGDHPVRLTVHGLRRFLARRLHEAEHLARAFVEPVAEVVHPVLLLDLQILAMGVRGHIRRQRLDLVVHVEIERHGVPQPQRGCSPRSMPRTVLPTISWTRIELAGWKPPQRASR